MKCRHIDRTDDIGKACGCGVGKSGCTNCGLCETCGEDFDLCYEPFMSPDDIVAFFENVALSRPDAYDNLSHLKYIGEACDVPIIFISAKLNNRFDQNFPRICADSRTGRCFFQQLIDTNMITYDNNVPPHDLRVVVTGSEDIPFNRYQGSPALNVLIVSPGLLFIEAHTYSSCEKLRVVALPDNIELLGKSSFEGCKQLQRIVIRSGLKKIDDCAFSQCVHLREVILPNGVEIIGNEAFRGCQSLRHVTIGSGLQIVGRQAFEKCVKLKEIYLPHGLQGIGVAAFRDCNMLTTVTLRNAACVSDFAFSRCSSLASIVLPEEIEGIGQFAFSVCTSLEMISVGSRLQFIGRNAFEKCSTLQGIYFPEGFESVGSSAFLECSALQTVQFGYGLQSIGPYAFADCVALAAIQLPLSVEMIGRNAFCRCSNIESVHVTSQQPSQGELTIEQHRLRGIGQEAFLGCAKLREVVLPAGVEKVGKDAFLHCHESLVIPKGMVRPDSKCIVT